jgi:hypothetical protein
VQMTLSKDSRVAIPTVATLARIAANAADPPPAQDASGAVGSSGTDWSSRPYSQDVIIPCAGFRQTRTSLQMLTLLAGVIGVAFFVPIAVLILGIPVALAGKGIAEAGRWLGAWLLN